MGKDEKITIKKDRLQKMERKLSRQEEIDVDPNKGFKSKHSVHKSKKTYTRKGGKGKNQKAEE